jgi:hypothetical protein
MNRSKVQYTVKEWAYLKKQGDNRHKKKGIIDFDQQNLGLPQKSTLYDRIQKKKKGKSAAIICPCHPTNWYIQKKISAKNYFGNQVSKLKGSSITNRQQNQQRNKRNGPNQAEKQKELTFQLKRQGRTHGTRHHKAYLHTELSILLHTGNRLAAGGKLARDLKLKHYQTQEKNRRRTQPERIKYRDAKPQEIRFLLWQERQAVTSKASEQPPKALRPEPRPSHLAQPAEGAKNLTTAAHRTTRTSSTDLLLPGSPSQINTQESRPTHPGRRRKQTEFRGKKMQGRANSPTFSLTFLTCR